MIKEGKFKKGGVNRPTCSLGPKPKPTARPAPRKEKTIHTQVTVDMTSIAKWLGVTPEEFDRALKSIQPITEENGKIYYKEKLK